MRRAIRQNGQPIIQTAINAMVLFVLGSWILIGCDSTGTAPKKLDRSTAAPLIKKSKSFTKTADAFVEAEFAGLPCQDLLQNPARFGPTWPLLVQLKDWGLIVLHQIGCEKPYPPNIGYGFFQPCSCQATLSEAGKSQSTNWITQQFPSGWLIPFANKEIIKITGVLGGEGNGATVEYTWKWTFNDLGQRLKDRGLLKDFEPAWGLLKENKASATFAKYDDGWRLIDEGF